jgi:hypothetical protein
LITPTSSNGQPSNNIDSNLYEIIDPYETTDHSDLSFDVGERISLKRIFMIACISWINIWIII